MFSTFSPAKYLVNVAAIRTPDDRYRKFLQKIGHKATQWMCFTVAFHTKQLIEVEMISWPPVKLRSKFSTSHSRKRKIGTYAKLAI